MRRGMSALRFRALNFRTISFCFGIFLFLILVNHFRQIYTLGTDEYRLRSSAEYRNSFLYLARQVGTDKVDHHVYQCIYEESLAPYRNIPGIKILEIGLGCNMPYGPGASMKLWSSYFADANIYFLEFDQKCGEKWYASLTGKKPIMTYGDQADVQLLRKMVEDHGPWDIIVDDGGHTMEQQINSFTELFPAVTPGGTYYLEDLSTSMVPNYGGNPTGLTLANGSGETAISFVGDVLALSMSHEGLGKNVAKITCCDELCAFLTKSFQSN